MNKLIYIVCVIGLFSSIFVTVEMNNMEKTNVFSAENVNRVRNNIARKHTPLIDPFQIVLDAYRLDHRAEEILCLQKNIYFESRNQSYIGQISVAWVTINRVRHEEWGNTICDVVYDAHLNWKGNPKLYRCQFSWFCDGLSDDPNLTNKFEIRAWEIAGKIASTMIQSCLEGIDPIQCPDDPTNGAVFFKRTDVPKQLTNRGTSVTTKIGDVTFFALNN